MTFKHKLSRRLAAMWTTLLALSLASASCGETAITGPGELVPWDETIAAALPGSASAGVEIRALAKVKVWSQPSRFSSVAGTQAKHSTGVIVEGPTAITSREPYALWRINFGNGADGWSRGDQLGFVNPVPPPDTAAPVPVPMPIATVTVSPGIDSVETGTTTQLSATVRDAQGNALTDRIITWTSLNNTVATVNGGLVTAVSAGTVLVSASSEGISGVATVTVTVPAPPPPPPGDTTGTRQVVWSSDWSMGLGLVSSTLTDGTRWSMLGGMGLEVISASGLGFPTTNVLRVTARGETTGYAFLRKTGLAIPAVGESNFYRWYFRATMPDGLEDAETHPFQDGNAASQSNWLFHVYHDAGAGRWRPQLRARMETNPYPNDRWSGPALAKHVTYRFELQIARTGTNTYRMNVRIYDQAGTLIHGNSAFTNQTGTATLAADPTFTFWQLANLEGLNAGNNGIAGTPTWPFVYGYQAAIAVCRGTWCGAYVAGEGR